MLSISTIKTYMYCPLKLYFQREVDEIYDEDEYFVPKSLKDLRVDIQDILHKNLRLLKKDMELNEIEETLSKGIFNQIETTFQIIEELSESKKEKDQMDNENSNPYPSSKIEFLDEDKRSDKLENEDDGEDEMERLKENLIDEVNLNIKILSLKVMQAMKVLDKDGSDIQNLFFQSSMYNTLIRDLGLDLIGVIDKIEVERGKYFPILLKTSNPPSKGVWESDEIELIANAMLVEGEFDTHITVGFVDYLKIAERRPIVIDTHARKNFFKLLTKINRIVEHGEIPHVKTSLNKCKNCEYKDLCEKS